MTMKAAKITEIPMQEIVWIDAEPYFPLQTVAWMTGNRVEEVMEIITEFNLESYIKTSVTLPFSTKEVPCVSHVGCVLIAMGSKSEKAMEFKSSLAEYVVALNYNDSMAMDIKGFLFQLICGYRTNRTDKTDRTYDKGQRTGGKRVKGR